MENLSKLRDMLCRELDEIVMKGDLSAGDLDTAHKLTDTIKNIDKIEMLDSGYSDDGGWRASGTYGNHSVYGRSGTHYVRGHYSRDDGRDRMADRIESMMNEPGISSNERNALRRAAEAFRE